MGVVDSKIRKEENVPLIKVVKQLKVTNYSFLFLFIIFTTVSDSNQRFNLQLLMLAYFI